MRIKIRLKHLPNILLPFDYQYAVQEWIYRIASRADKELGNNLHNIGYVYHNKPYKLFCFSPWYGQPYLIDRNKGIVLKSDISEIKISFALPNVLQSFIAGLFTDQNHTFFFKGGHSFDVQTVGVELLPPLKMDSSINIYSLKSGARLSIHLTERKHPLYIDPTHPEYKARFLQNLINKHQASILNSENLVIDINDLDFKLLGDFRSHKYNVHKEGNTIQSIAYSYDFELNAPIPIHEILNDSGAGEECSLGLGWVEFVRIM